MSITNTQKIEIAKDFVNLHRYQLDEWQPFNLHGDEKYLQIYHNMLGGMYGGTEYTSEQKGEDSDCLEIEIDNSDSLSGLTTTFELLI